MQDKLIVTGILATGGIAGVGWLELVSDAATLVSTIIVGSLTAWYIWEKAAKLRRERKRDEGEDN